MDDCNRFARRPIKYWLMSTKTDGVSDGAGPPPPDTCLGEIAPARHRINILWTTMIFGATCSGSPARRLINT